MHDKISLFDIVDTRSSIKSESMIYKQKYIKMFMILLVLSPHILLKLSYSVVKLCKYLHFQHIFSLKIFLINVSFKMYIWSDNCENCQV